MTPGYFWRRVLVNGPSSSRAAIYDTVNTPADQEDSCIPHKELSLGVCRRAWRWQHGEYLTRRYHAPHGYRKIPGAHEQGVRRVRIKLKA